MRMQIAEQEGKERKLINDFLKGASQIKVRDDA